MINTCTILGRVVADPELRETSNGTSVANIRVAVDRKPDKNGDTDADFFTVVCWSGCAEFVAKNFVKGQPIAVTGRLQQRTWEDEDDNTHIFVEIVAENVSFAGGAPTKSEKPEKPKSRNKR